VRVVDPAGFPPMFSLLTVSRCKVACPPSAHGDYRATSAPVQAKIVSPYFLRVPAILVLETVEGRRSSRDVILFPVWRAPGGRACASIVRTATCAEESFADVGWLLELHGSNSGVTSLLGAAKDAELTDH